MRRDAVVPQEPVHLGFGLAAALPLERHEGATGREPIRATDGHHVAWLNSGLAPRGIGVHARSPSLLLLDENLH
jgi:hypothetical protein